MSTVPEQRQWTREDYERAAQEYYLTLPLEHFMEATPQFSQRLILADALGWIHRHRPQLHFFGELCVLQFVEGQLVRVVPDLMVVLGDLEDQKRGSYAPELELPVFWALEIVSPSNRGEYTEKRELYEQKLKVPYYLIYDPEAAPLQLCLYRHDGTEYQIVRPNEHGRYPIQEIDLEIGLIDGWARLWFEGELVKTADEREEAFERQGEENREQQRQLTEKDDQLTEATEEMRRKDDEMRRKDEQLNEATDQLRQREREASAVIANLRALVESKARQAGRQDILDALPATTAPDTLFRWLGELG
jgi:Uma2 family endonuclease